MEKRPDQQARSESKARLMEQIKACLHSSHYSHALDLLRGGAAEFPNDAELGELEKTAQNGVKRTAEANRLITESQELFAQRKSAEAIQLLRKAYELDKNNALARAILANALVEHANSLVETDWLEAETLANQALGLNPAHPTAKTIRSTVEDRKKNSVVDDWVEHARKRQSSGDLFAALAWVAEGLAVHPDDPKLVQIQDEIQRDQGARRRQARRSDLDDLRRMEREIAGASDVAAKQALADRIQALAAKHWTDGEILSIANAFLLRLGLVPKEGSAGSAHKKGAALILRVPRPSAPEAPPATTPVKPALPRSVPADDVVVDNAPAGVGPIVPAGAKVPPSSPSSDVEPGSAAPASPQKVPSTPAAPQVSRPKVIAVPAAEAVAAAAKLPVRSSEAASKPKAPTKSKGTTLVVVSVAAAIIMVAAIFFLRKQQASPVAKTPAVAGDTSAASVPAPSASAPANSAPTVGPSAPATTEPAPNATATSESSPPALPPSSDATAGKVTPDHQPTESGRNLGALIVVAGQDNAKVFLNGKLQRQLTQGGQLRLPNLELKDYVVQVSKSGFQDPPSQKIRIRGGEQASLIFKLQPQPTMASLNIQGGAPGTTVLVDQVSIGTIQSDGTLSVSTVNPGDHVVELRKERFKPRQMKKHFVAGGAVSLVAADVALEAAASEVKITFTPADARVAIVKGDLLTNVSSGVPLNLAPGTYTLTARNADTFTRSSTFDIVAGQSKNLDLSLAPNGMSKWDDPSAWKQEGDSFLRKGGDFVLYGVVPTAGTFTFSAMPAKGHLLQWVLNYSDAKNYILFQMDDNSFHRTVIRNGEKHDEIIVPDKSDRKSFRTLRIRVSPNEILQQIRHGNSWTVLDRWTQPGANLSVGKFGFYIPGSDQVALSSFAHYADLNIR